VTLLQKRFIDVSNKARKIHEEASKLAITRSVPVSQDARNVRAAVLRQDDPSGGIRISFDLYQTSIDYLRRERNALNPAILDELSGDFVTDQKKISARIKQTTEDIGEEFAQLLGSQIIVLAVLKLLQLGTDSVSAGLQDATKEPKSAEIPVIVANLALSIAAQQLYAGLNEEEIARQLEELNAEMPSQRDMNAAKQKLKEMPLFQAGLQSLNPSDHRLIVDYVRSFINRQSDPGWETWQLADDLLEKAEWAEGSSAALDRYIPQDRDLEDTQSPSVAGLDTLFTNINVPEFAPAPVPPSTDVTALYDRTLNSINQQVDNMAQVLGFSADVTDVCCLFNFLNSMDIDVLERGRNMVDSWQKGLRKIDRSLRGGQFVGNLTISTTIHQAIMLMLHDVMQNTVAKFKLWFTTNTDRWKALANCRLIDELIEFMVRSMESLESLFVSYLDRYLGFVEDTEAAFDQRISLVGNWKEARTIIRLMDQYLEFAHAGLGGVCLEDDPATLTMAVQQALDGLGSQIAVPIILDGDPYQTVQAPPLVLDTGIVMPAAAGQPAGTTVLEAAQQACRTGTVRQNLVPFPRGE
jgi:hypothetical protein